MNPELPSSRNSRQSAGVQSIIKLLLAAVILVLVNFIGFKQYMRKDLSASQYYTLSAKTTDVLNKLDGPLHIYTFLNEANAVEVQQIDNLLEEYAHAQRKYLTYEKVDTAIDSKRAAELQQQLHFDGNDAVIVLQYKDHTPRFVKQADFYDYNPMTQQVAGFKGEQQLTGAILALVEGKSSRIYFTEGHGEHSIHDSNSAQGFGQLGGYLKDDNVEADTINLAEKGEVPADADAVVVAGPSIPFAPIEASALEKYLGNNGKLIIMVDPFVTTGLDGVLAKYGLRFDDDVVLRRGVEATGEVMTLPRAIIYEGGFSSQPITAKFAQANFGLIVPNARSITLPPPSAGAEPKTAFLLQSEPDAWGWMGKPDSAQFDVTALQYNKVTDLPGPLTIAAQYDGGPATNPLVTTTTYATRIVAVGSAKFLDNDALTPLSANFFTNSVDWLVKKDAVLNIAPKKPTEYGLEVSPISYRTLIWTTLGVIPLTALLLGIFTWLSRRK
jgi:ABC-type uncharacterized transport system involved in gliding motility auxiliary subunit